MVDVNVPLHFRAVDRPEAETTDTAVVAIRLDAFASGTRIAL